MPRKHKNEDNVVPFQTTRNPAQPDAAQAQQDGIPVVIKKIDENRASGMKNLEKKCDNFDHREMITEDNPITENTLRDIEGAIKSTMLTLEAMNSLLDMLRHDLIGAIQNIEAGSVGNWQMSAHLQVLLDLLKEKGVVTEEELKGTWEKIVPAMINKLKGEKSTDSE
jgi:hypothetical protein